MTKKRVGTLNSSRANNYCAQLIQLILISVISMIRKLTTTKIINFAQKKLEWWQAELQFHTLPRGK